MRLLIVTPSLGRSPYIRKTVESVDSIRRECGWIISHVIVAPAGVIEQLRKECPECEIIAETGRSLYQAVNWTYINDDDYLLPGFLNVLAQAATVDSPVVIYGRVMIIDACGSVKNRVTRWVLPFGMRGALGGRRSPLNQQGALWSARTLGLIGGFDGSLKYASDYDYFFRCSLARIKFRYDSSFVAAYRVHVNQLGQDGVPFMRELCTVRGRYKVARIQVFICGILFVVSNLDIYLWRILRRKPFGVALFSDIEA